MPAFIAEQQSPHFRSACVLIVIVSNHGLYDLLLKLRKKNNLTTISILYSDHTAKLHKIPMCKKYGAVHLKMCANA